MGETKIDLSADEVRMIGGVLEMRGKNERDAKLKIIFCYNYKNRKNTQTCHDTT